MYPDLSEKTSTKTIIAGVAPAMKMYVICILISVFMFYIRINDATDEMEFIWIKKPQFTMF